jgi:uncharacterized protein
MKRKYANRPDWTRIIEKSYKCMFIEEENFRGYVAFLALNKVREPLWVRYGQDKLCIVDDDYVWLQFFPLNGYTMLTATYDAAGELVQCYYDIVKKNGISSDWVPYCDDLYVDVVALPNGDIHTLDEDELSEAYERQAITKKEYDFAIAECTRLKQSIRDGTNYLLRSTNAYYHFLKSLR